MQIATDKKVFFLSDFHLGAPDAKASLEREKKIVSFLEEIRASAAAIFIVGDMFDFWFEYRKVVPKGYVRLLGKLAEISDQGIPIHFFVGNHDMWMNNYFQSELQIKLYLQPEKFTFNNRKFLIGHGDGLGPGDHGYKVLKKLFRNPAARWGFGILPPWFGISIANFFSQKSRANTGKHEEVFLGGDKEWLITYCKQILQKESFDYFIFGHRHLPIDYKIDSQSRYVNLGDWINYYTYAVFDGQQLALKSRYPELENKIVRN